MPLGFAIELCPSDAALRAHPSAFGVDADSFHLREIDHHAAVDRCASCYIVTATTDRNLETKSLGEPYRIGYVGGIATLRDERWPFVDKSIVDLSCLLVARIAWLHK
ncbi:hypothetical protein KUF59_32130 [Bradyrhizobium arachidis]|nr:hypothetical protein [Bradyrhizobium arachidis]UVO33593.1 hypothetical protein KUF59_32130 [Bradyrhizobium arachidis]